MGRYEAIPGLGLPKIIGLFYSTERTVVVGGIGTPILQTP